MEKSVLDSVPRREVSNLIELPVREPEMTEAESAFLCGLINQEKPCSIVEVGVAGGGTSAIILQCLNKLNHRWRYYAVDCSEEYYRDSSYKTGWLGEQFYGKSKISGDFSLLRGESLPYVIDQIIEENPVDFILLDTMHVLPGEILDFLLVFPFLSGNAVVCLHDISLNTKSPLSLDQIATNVLYNCVVSDKIINFDLVTNDDSTYPNIAAFRINKDTKRYIINVFGLLTLTWSYFPDHKEIEKYREYYCKYYDNDCIELFDRAFKINSKAKSSFYQRVRKAAKVLLVGRY